jgi:23S rRNA pseudouridine2605 synthase
VYDLLPAEWPWIFPAGRLDADSEGLLILTNDALLATRLTDPEKHVPKTYHVTVPGIPTEDELRQLRQGVQLVDGRTRPIEIVIVGRGKGETILEMVLREGRNRQIRRMWALFGRRVQRLVRVAIGGLPLGELATGAWRELGEPEIQACEESGRAPGNSDQFNQ